MEHRAAVAMASARSSTCELWAWTWVGNWVASAAARYPRAEVSIPSASLTLAGAGAAAIAGVTSSGGTGGRAGNLLPPGQELRDPAGLLVRFYYWPTTFLRNTAANRVVFQRRYRTGSRVLTGAGHRDRRATPLACDAGALWRAGLRIFKSFDRRA